jgi:hypothetical protein
MIDLGWTSRCIARRQCLAVVVIDVEATATPEDLEAVVSEIREAKGWESERERIAQFVESLPVGMWADNHPDYRGPTPAEIAAKIRGMA